MNPYQSEMDQLARKAMKYELFAKFFQYRDPNLHIYYYKKHLKCVEKLMSSHQIWSRDESSHRTSRLRVLHASPNAPAVDVYANGQRVLQNLSYKQVSDYLTIPAGNYLIEVYPAGQYTGNPVLRQRISVQPGRSYTAAAAGNVENLKLIPAVDKTRTAYDTANARFWHLSPDAPAVDIAVQGGEVIFPNVSFEEVTSYLDLSPGTVNLEVRLAGTNTTVLTVPNVNLQGGNAYTAVAVGYAEGTPELEAIFLSP